jgi:hypothetical protein
MSTAGQWGGGILGLVIGFVLGPYAGLTAVMGALYGAAIGYTVGNIISPTAPDIRSVGVPAQPFQFTPNTVGMPIADALGTVKITGFLVTYGKQKAKPQYVEISGGSISGSQQQLVGYKYYASWVLGICLGPIDTIYTIFKDDKVIWEGEVVRPISGGQETIAIPGMGSMILYFGTDDHAVNSTIGELLSDATLNSPLRGLCYAFFDNCFMNTYNRMPTMVFVVRKSPVLGFSTKNVIQVYDYNPAHAIYYILSQLAGLPTVWLYDADFIAVANQLHLDGLGVSLLLDNQQAALTYIETINTYIDSILQYGNDGKFHLKLIRGDYTLGDLPTVDESHMLEEPTLRRPSWIETINEVIIQYSQISDRIILDAYLLAWYKFDEGIGDIARNSAKNGCLGGGVFPDLDVLNPNLGFWKQLEGFASSSGWACDCALGELDAAMSFHGQDNNMPGWGIFYRATWPGYYIGNYYCYLFNVCPIDFSFHGFASFFRGMGYSSKEYRSCIYYNNVYAENMYLSYLLDQRWVFYFCASGNGAGSDYPLAQYLCVVTDDGVLHAFQNTFVNPVTDLKYIVAGAAASDGEKGYDSAKGSYADLIIYNHMRPKIKEWADWYDLLRTRYGMAKRSGW